MNRQLCKCCEKPVVDGRCPCWDVELGLSRTDQDRLMVLCLEHNICPPQTFGKMFGIEAARLYAKALTYVGNET